MELSEQLANRLEEVLLEGKWVTGTNFKEQIIDLYWKDATKKIDSLNSIADLTFHIHYYIAGVTKVLEGGPLEIKDEFSFDSPLINSNQDWRNLVDEFCSDSEKFQDFADEKYGNYNRNIDVMIEHTYYHLGQIILIKKLMKNKG